MSEREREIYFLFRIRDRDATQRALLKTVMKFLALFKYIPVQKALTNHAEVNPEADIMLS